MMEKGLLIASIIGALLLVVYSCSMALKKGAALGSLSETAYISRSPRIFTVVMVVSAFLISPRLIANAGGWAGFLGVIFWFGLCMVGASPHYKSIERTLHYIGAFVAAISSQLIVALCDAHLLGIWLLYIGYLFAVRKRHIFYEEVICFVVIMLFCILK